ncbi:hypothetical protein [Celerinatantimonas sp. MCCC 1A17872]|uniref:hypothetical protein n=1 Tax=Celerinatantimonas sp. MCCC 1A17872 TaxID=3177514 RepID=UPI0038C83B9E
MANFIMPNFKIHKASVMVCIIIIIVLSIFMVQDNSLKYREITHPNDIDGIVIGNSHANRILLNSDNIFYLNEGGGVIADSIEEFSYGKSIFPNLKYVIINITPMEMYINQSTRNPNDKKLLYKYGLNKYLNVFESKVTVSFSDFFKKVGAVFFNDLDGRGNKIVFIKNGRQLLDDREHSVDLDWVSKSHYREGLFIPNDKVYLDNLSKIRKIFANSKFKVVVISMPLNYRYITYMKNELNNHHLFDLNRFTNDMRSLFGNCYINLISYPLSDKYFLNGDHLNKEGAKYIKRMVIEKINKCLKPQFNVY